MVYFNKCAFSVQAISNPSNEELQDMAWRAVVPLVGKLKLFYEYACELEAVLPQLLHALCAGDLTPTEHLEQQQVSHNNNSNIIL